MNIKGCCQCGQQKPIQDFHKDSRRKDGHSPRCKSCAISNARYHYRKKRDELGLPKLKSRTSDEKKKDQRGRRLAYRSKHPGRIRANLKVQYAVANGHLPQIRSLTCFLCGNQASEYHHPDYHWPLLVVPLCKSCHRKLHLRIAITE